MIKYFENNTDRDYIINLIDNEEINLQVSRIFQENLKKEILSYSNTFISCNFLNLEDPNLLVAANFFWNISKALKNLSVTLEKCDELEENIKSLKKDVTSQRDFRNYDIKARITKYNKRFISINDCLTIKTNEVQQLIADCKKSTIFTDLLREQAGQKERNAEEIQNNIKRNTQILNELENKRETNNVATNQPSSSRESKLDDKNSAILDEFIAAPMIEFNVDTTDENPKTTNRYESGPLPKVLENTLIVSEKNDKVVLPYTMEDLTNKLRANPNKYKSIEDVVDKEYTRPLQYYKNTIISRFKEAFKLVRDRNHGSFKHAFDLAFELAFCYNLHPAIISACKNVDELDVYLSCLEYDELEDFKFFKIIFDVLPKLTKKNKSFI